MAEVICTHEECESILLCDKTASSTTPFIRRFCEEADGSVRVEDLDLDGSVYTIQGEIGACGDRHDLEKQVMCDSAGMTFLRWYVTRDGEATGEFFDTDLAGADVVPTDPVKVGDCCGCATSTTQPMCDAGTPAEEPVNLSLSGLSCPANGTSSNSVNWQVDQCDSTQIGQPPTEILLLGQAGDGPVQTWTFDRAVDLEFDLRPSTSGAVGCVELPPGTEVVQLDPVGGMTWDPATRQACSTANTSFRAANRFRIENITSFTLNALDLGAASWGLVGLTVAPAASGPIQFLRHLCLDCDGNVLSFTDTTIDGSDYTPQGEVNVGECSSSSDSDGITSTTQALCDVLPTPPVAPYTFDFAASNEGITSTPVTQATAPNGVVYSINQGSWSPNGGDPGYFSLGNNTDTHQWTFHNGPVDLEFDIRDTQLTLLSKYLQFPQDTVMLEVTQPNVTWDDVAKRLRRDPLFTNTASPNRFRLTNVTSLALSAPNALASWGLFGLTVTPRSSGPDPVQFLRHITFDSGGDVLSVVDVNLDGTAYQVQGQVQLCG
ncbi:hypothetical protein [Chelativorans alearense]|uniref:hypothetical protein n=1 Tax=Chelativorans alearense TaxID=2681495 RepID=UPI0013D715A6|nr:hypothetical protein [Chelativorans alearense]